MPTTKTTKKAPVVKAEGTPLADIAASLKMDPKNARARLRRVDTPKGATVGNSWTFTKEGVAWAKAQLKRDGRKTS